LGYSVLEFLTENTIQLLIIFVAPGFISLKIWGLIHPSQKILISESLIEAIIFSSFNYIITIWLYLITKNTNFIWIYFLIVLIVFPILWPILLKAILDLKFFKKIIISLIPKSWDYFFSKRECCFMLVHLNNGRIIGGLYGIDSFASSYPEKEDIYLQEVWKVDAEGKFIERVIGSKGLLVNYDAIEYIELFDIDGGGNNG
jgi:hypothetical protein